MLSDELKLLVGLGNPGTEYEKTRHNVGFMVLEEIARKNNCSFRESKKLFGRTCEYGSGIEKTRLLMPNTYMNESGKSDNIPIPKVINLFLFMILLVFQLSWSPLLSNIKVFLVHSITSFYSLFFFWTSSHTIS